MINQEDLKLLEQHLSFWDYLTPSQRDQLLENTREVTYPRRHMLHCGDSECLGVLFVKEGTLRVYIISEEGREVTLYRMPVGSVCVLTASCVLSDITFDVSVETESECRLLQIGAGLFSRLTEANVYVELFSYRVASERFSDIMWAMQQVLFTSFDKRLASFLLEEARKEPDAVVHMTHEQIARYLGTAREVVSRMLKYFSNEGYVSLFRGGVRLIKPHALEKLIAN